MITFNFKALLRFIHISLFKSKGTNYRLTPRRMGWLIVFGFLFLIVELANRVGFLLDNIFFRNYRCQEINSPVFIIGNPRSGTTFLQRLMAKDSQNFSCMKTWEILFAPSITQRKIVRAVLTVDRWLGDPLRRLITAGEGNWEEQNAMHRVALRAHEEDEYLMLHIWSSLAAWQYSAILEDEPYTYFDTAVSAAEKERIMYFYTRCIQRHLHARGDGGKRYLAKNPSFSPKVDTLYRHFPDAKFVYLVRSPLNVIPSYISLAMHGWHLLGNPLEEYACRDYALRMTRHWYTYPLERLEQAPEDSYVVINFNDLTQSAEQIVTQIYDQFDIDMSPEFAQILYQEAERARNYRSRHEYSLEEMGLDVEQIYIDYQDVFERFGFDAGFDAGDPPGPERPQPRKRRRKQRKTRSKRRPRRGVEPSTPNG